MKMGESSLSAFCIFFIAPYWEHKETTSAQSFCDTGLPSAVFGMWLQVVSLRISVECFVQKFCCGDVKFRF